MEKNMNCQTTLRAEVAAAGEDKEKVFQAFQKYEVVVFHPVYSTLCQLETLIHN